MTGALKLTRKRGAAFMKTILSTLHVALMDEYCWFVCDDVHAMVLTFIVGKDTRPMLCAH